MTCAIYKEFYATFDLKYHYFYVVYMLSKVAVGWTVYFFPPDTEDQLIAVAVIQCAFTILVYITSPFFVDACNYILESGQAYILFTLIMSCFFRAADQIWDGWAYVLITVSVINLLFQFYQTVLTNVRLCWAT